MENQIDPLLENLHFSVDKQKNGLAIIDKAMDKPTDYPVPYLIYGFDKYRIVKEKGTVWRVHELELEYVFDAPKDAAYLNADTAKRNRLKAIHSNTRITELNHIVFGLVNRDNPYADKYTGAEDKNTRFKLADNFIINGQVGINRHGSDENQNWSVKTKFDLISLESAWYACSSQNI